MASYSTANRSYYVCVLVSGPCFFFSGLWHVVSTITEHQRPLTSLPVVSARSPPKSESSPQKVNGELAARGGVGGCRGGKERRDEEEGNELWGPVSRAGDIMGESD